jgi:hypothetical protein
MKRITYSGYCPTQGINYNVVQEEVETTTQSDSQRTYIKGMFECEYGGLNGCPLLNNCPLANPK